MKVPGWFVPVVLLFFLGITNRWLSFPEGISVMHANDSVEYLRIVKAAPYFSSETVRLQFAQRFFFFYAAGILSDLSGVSPENMLRIFMLTFILFICFLLYKILTELHLTMHGLIFFLSLAILNPYQFRYYIAVPAMIPDTAFVLGLTICIYALLRKNLTGLFLGVLVAGLARQTVVAILPGVSIWILFAREYRNSPRRWLWIFIIWTIGLSTYLVTAKIFSGFWLPTENNRFMTAIFLWISDSFHFPVLAEFLARAAIPFLFPLASLVGMRLGVRQKLPVHSVFWGCLIISLGVSLQPILSGPGAMTTNITRVAALGVIPFLIAVAAAANQWKIFSNPAMFPFWMAVSLISVSSFHHMYSVLARTTVDAKFFALFYSFAALLTGSLCYVIARRNALIVP